MADDPKKKKKPAPTDSAGAGSLAAAPKPYAAAELTDDEYNQQAQLALKAAPEGESGGTSTPEPESPVKSWWQRFNDVMSKTRDPKEMVRGAARGVVNAGVETVKTISEGAAAIDRKTGLGEALSPGFNDSYDRMGGARGVVNEFAKPTQEKVEQVLGKRPDDGLAAFTESATQFISSFALMPGKGVVAGLAKGAVTDFSAFDPYEAQLAELAARSGVPGLKQLGDALSVNGDDSAALARFKRAAAGAIPGVVIEGLVAGARGFNALGKLKAGAAGAEKKAAEETLAESQKTVAAIADGSHVSDDAHVRVVPKEDGWDIEHTNGTDPLEGVQGSNRLTFDDEAEALQQAESMNHSIQDKLNAGKVEIDHEEVQKAIEAGESPELTVSSHNTVDDDMKLVKSLSDAIIAKKDAIEATTGGRIALEEQRRIAKEALAQIPEDQLHGTIKGLLKANPESQDVVGMASDMVMGQYERDIIKLHDVVEQRPHDPVAMEQLVNTINHFYELRHEMRPGESAAGRRLRNVQERPALRQETFDTAEQAAAAKSAQAPAVQEAADTFDDVLDKIKKNRTDTISSSASDFSLARERNRLKTVLKKLYNGDAVFEHDPELAVERANKINKAADEQRSEPITVSPEEEKAAAGIKTKTTNPIEELSKWLDGSDEALDKDLEKGAQLIQSARDDIAKLQENAATRRAENPVGSFIKDQAHKEGEPVAGMATRDASQFKVDEANAKLVARMFKLSGGAPRDVDAIVHATQVMQKGGTGRKVLEVFTNFLLSGPPTWATVTLSGGALSHFEPFVKMAAGTIGGSPAMVREGVDTLFGLYAHLGDNIKVAAAAMREGRSIVNPAPTTYAIGGLTGKIVRAPGNIMLGLDEFTRVSNYRAFVRAKSLRAGREAGLEGMALAKRVDEDLRMAFDPNTGIATIPTALKYADIPTLSGGLTPGGFGSALQQFTNNALAAKFVVPFVRASTNIFNYVWQATPVLNAFNAEAREIMKKGGEEAAALHARSMAATTLGLFAWTQAAQGNLTGKGPSDPDLRKAWLGKDGNMNQPYSIKIGGKWISYNRLDPLATPLGLVADLYTFQHELGTEHADVEKMTYATLGALAANLSSKTYLRGIFDFSEAWSKGDENAVGRYLQRQVTSTVVPSIVDKFNPDPYYREVESMADAIKSKLPYFSTALDARYNFLGEKDMKAPHVANRALNPLTVRDAKASKVEQELLSIGKGLAPAPEKIGDGMIDLHDKSYAEKADQPSPYTRMMELIRNPGSGLPSLREAMEERIKGPGWDDLSDGTEDFKGGRKWLILAGVKQQYEARALRQVREEYPKLDKKYRSVLRAKGAATSGGEEAQAASELLNGPIH